MNTFALFVAMLAPAIFVAAALAQTQLPPPAGRRLEVDFARARNAISTGIVGSNAGPSPSTRAGEGEVSAT